MFDEEINQRDAYLGVPPELSLILVQQLIVLRKHRVGDRPVSLCGLLIASRLVLRVDLQHQFVEVTVLLLMQQVLRLNLLQKQKQLVGHRLTVGAELEVSQQEQFKV